MSVGGFGHRAPLLWLLLPFMAGLTAGRLLDLPAPPLLGAAAIVLLLALVLSSRSSAVARWTWPLALGGAVALAAAAYFQVRLNRPPEWSGLPPREARLTLQVTHVFSSAYDRNRINGLAVVAEAAAHLRGLTHQRLYFSLNIPARDRSAVALGPDLGDRGDRAVAAKSRGRRFRRIPGRRRGEFPIQPRADARRSVSAIPLSAFLSCGGAAVRAHPGGRDLRPARLAAYIVP